MHKYFPYIIFLFSFTFVPFLVNGQETPLNFKHIGISNGLSQNSVQTIIEDDLGFVWIGTTDGLNRYDGYEIKVFNYRPSDPHSICNNDIKKIVKDNSGRLWIGTKSGLAFYDPKKERFTNFLHDHNKLNSLATNKVQDLLFQNDTILWIATDHGLSRLNIKQNKFVNYHNNSSSKIRLSFNDIMCLEIEGDSILWLGSFGGGLDKVNLLTESVTHFEFEKNNTGSLSYNYLRDLFLDKNNNLWIGTEYGLGRFVSEENKIINYYKNPTDENSLTDDWVNKIWQDKEGTLWIGTDGGGLSIFDVSKNQFRNIKQASSATSLSDNRIYEIYEDSNGLMWIGTWGGGVNLLNPYAKKFYTYSGSQNDSNSLSNNHVFCFIEESPDKVWVGTIGGLYLFDMKHNSFKRIDFVLKPTINSGLNFIFCMAYDHKDNLWIGTREGLIKYNVKKGLYDIFRNDPHSSNSLNYNPIWSLLYDNDKLWIGTAGGGLDEFIIKENKFIHHHHNPNDKFSLSNNAVTYIEKDSEGYLWLTTESGGLNKYDPITNQFTHYQHDPDNPNSLAIDNLYNTYIDKNGIVWIGTTIGLNRFDPRNEVFDLIDESKGLPNNVIYTILEDGRGNFWIGTNKGLTKFNPETNSFTNFFEKDGLQSNEFNLNAKLKLHDGRMIFGGVNGFNIFDPDKITNNPLKPRVHITELQILNQAIEADQPFNGRVILTNSILYTNKIILSHEDKVIALKFAGLNYLIPEDNQYSYILEGFEEEWNYAGNRRFVMYTNLTPGEYVFRVKASNNDGIWSQETTDITIVIEPPFWRTWWFILISISITAFVIVVAHKMRVRKIQHQKEELEAEVKKRTKDLKESNATKDRFFSILAHDLRGPFNSILGNTQLLSTDISNLSSEDITNLAKDLNLSVQQFYTLLENLLKWSNLQLNNTEYSPESIELKKVFDNNYILLKEMLKKKNISFIVDIKEDENIYGDLNMINSIFQNLITNSIKFTYPGGNIKIRSERENGYTSVIISDSGVGIQKNKLKDLFRIDKTFSTPGTNKERGSGLGLILCKEFVEKNGGSITVSSEENKGTIFTVRLKNTPGMSK